MLPVFYYNDLLASRVGETIGLNFFEPRYLEMCERMGTDPRFISMPNFEDYTCMQGDVGFIIRVTELVPQRNRRGYSVRGVAETMVAVASTWVEPETEGLHFAKVWRLDHGVSALNIAVLGILCRALTELGWRKRETRDARVLECPALEHEGGHLLIGCNWPHISMLLAPALASEAERAAQSRHLEAAWTAARRELPQMRIPDGSFADLFVHKVPNFPVVGVPVKDLVDELNDLIRRDGISMAAELGLLYGAVPWGFASRAFLSRARVCGLGEMSADMETPRLELMLAHQNTVMSCFPRARCPSRASMTPEVAVHVFNNANVHLIAWLEDVLVTASSAAATVAFLRWRLNATRVRLIQRARVRGQGLFAHLEEDAAQQVFSYIAAAPAPTPEGGARLCRA